MIELFGRRTHDELLHTLRSFKRRVATRIETLIDEGEIPLRSIAEYCQYNNLQISWSLRNANKCSLRRLINILTATEIIARRQWDEQVVYVVYPFSVEPAFGKTLRYSPSELCELFGITPDNTVPVDLASDEQLEEGIHLKVKDNV